MCKSYIYMYISLYMYIIYVSLSFISEQQQHLVKPFQFSCHLLVLVWNIKMRTQHTSLLKWGQGYNIKINIKIKVLFKRNNSLLLRPSWRAIFQSAGVAGTWIIHRLQVFRLFPLPVHLSRPKFEDHRFSGCRASFWISAVSESPCLWPSLPFPALGCSCKALFLHSCPPRCPFPCICWSWTLPSGTWESKWLSIILP